MASVSVVPPEDVYNLPLFECFLVVDARSKEEYESEHVVTAVSFPAMSPDTDEATKMAALLKFLTVVVSNLPERVNPIVVYGSAENTPLFQAHVTWLTDMINKMKGDTSKAVSLFTAGIPTSSSHFDDETREKYNPVQTFCNSLVKALKNIWIIEGGYECFKAVFPFLCGRLNTADMKPLPHQIEKFLFLGSRAFQITPEALYNLNINFVIVNKAQNNDSKLAINSILILSLGLISFDHWKDVHFLECDVEDESTENMSDCWKTSIDFIRTAVASGGRVLVQLWGRSRSASVVLAWLMVSKGWSLEVAEQFLLSKCSSVGI